MDKNFIKLHFGDSREVLKKYPNGYFNLIITSPPYADARKNHYDSISPELYTEYFTSFHEEFWRVLANDGSFVLNIKDKVIDGQRNRYVWKTVMALNDLGWLSIDDYIWHKPNAMPGFWPNRLRDEWEYCFHFTKNKKFKMYQDSIKKPVGEWAEKRLSNLNGKSSIRHNSENNSGFGRDLNNWVNKDLVLPGNTLSIPVVGKNMGHPAVFPLGLPSFFIKLFTTKNDNILDPFGGCGTTGIASNELNRNVVLIDNKEEYFKIMEEKFNKMKSLFTEVSSENKIYNTELPEFIRIAEENSYVYYSNNLIPIE